MKKKSKKKRRRSYRKYYHIFNKYLRKNSSYIIISVIIVAIAVCSVLLYLNIKHQRTSIKQEATLQSTSAKTINTTVDKKNNFNVPILMYHYIRVAPENDSLGQDLSVAPDVFDAQLQWMKDSGFTTIKMTDLADPDKKEISKIYSENKKPIILTFDDGYDDASMNALPILQKYGFSGTFYIIRNFVGRPGYLTQTQIDQMAEANMEIGSHSLDHPNLAKLSESEQKRQIFDSKIAATSFCYPSGQYSGITASLVKSAGYTTAVTTKPGVANQNSTIFELPRVRVKNFPPQKLDEEIKKYESFK